MFCRLGEILLERFLPLWAVKNPDGDGPGMSSQKARNQWLKDNYEGRTWSKMSPEAWYHAIASLRVDTDTGVLLDADEPGEDDPEYQAFLAEPDPAEEH